MKDEKKIMRAPKYGGHSGEIVKINAIYIVKGKDKNYRISRTKKTLMKVAKRAYVDTKGKFYVLSLGVAYQSGDYVSTINARSIDDEKTLINLCEKHLDGEIFRKYLNEEVIYFGDGVKKMHDKEEFLYRCTANLYLLHLLALSVFEEFGINEMPPLKCNENRTFNKLSCANYPAFVNYKAFTISRAEPANFVCKFKTIKQRTKSQRLMREFAGSLQKFTQYPYVESAGTVCGNVSGRMGAPPVNIIAQKGCTICLTPKNFGGHTVEIIREAYRGNQKNTPDVATNADSTRESAHHHEGKVSSPGGLLPNVKFPVCGRFTQCVHKYHWPAKKIPQRERNRPNSASSAYTCCGARKRARVKLRKFRGAPLRAVESVANSPPGLPWKSRPP